MKVILLAAGLTLACTAVAFADWKKDALADIQAQKDLPKPNPAIHKKYRFFRAGGGWSPFFDTLEDCNKARQERISQLSGVAGSAKELAYRAAAVGDCGHP